MFKFVKKCIPNCTKRELKAMGIEHFTSFDSIVYHIHEGEMDE